MMLFALLLTGIGLGVSLTVFVIYVQHWMMHRGSHRIARPDEVKP